ncbi:Protein obstructor-E [Eumeta japonica]|uniref:Protein obstructor-E n=1 Tax=Eumeta variegata TaxID=151549 RepID=A0A4C1Y6A9_EUMVA|nr:Protein obstructor-E [Eumeta japonica]
MVIQLDDRASNAVRDLANFFLSCTVNVTMKVKAVKPSEPRCRWLARIDDLSCYEPFIWLRLLPPRRPLAYAGVLLENAPTCPEPHGLQAYAHPEHCDQFFLCTNGTLTLETCENGLLFDGKGAVHNHCNYNWAVECGERKADPTNPVLAGSKSTHSTTEPSFLIQTTADISVTPISSPGCEYQFGIYPDSEECSTSYVKCAFGLPEQEACQPGLAYDHRIHGCNWPDLLQPFCNPEAVVGFKCPVKLPSNSPSAKFWPFPRFPVPGDCHRLITCVEGHPRLITCEEGKVFDEENLTCEDAELVPHCGRA